MTIKIQNLPHNGLGSAISADQPQHLIEHIEELRRRLLKSLAAVVCGMSFCYIYVDRVLEYLAKPVGHMVYLCPTEAFFVRVKLSLSLGFMVSLPVILYQLWKFVAVALTAKERGNLHWVMPVSYFMFIAGIAFGFFAVVPVGVKFLLSYSSLTLAPMISVSAYLSFVTTMCLVSGAAFELPVVGYFLAHLGLLKSRWMSERRRMAVLIVYAVCAVLTPGPDPVSSLLIAVPSYILYELAILSARVAENQRKTVIDL